MKGYLAKISSFFFLAILLSSSIASLHVYFHEGAEQHNHCKKDVHLSHHGNENHDENEEETPCNICLFAFNISSLDYNTIGVYSFEDLSCIEHSQQNNSVVYFDVFIKQYCLNLNSNKAPPFLS